MDNSKTKIMTIVGARPQFVKAAMVTNAINAVEEDLAEVVVHTGQHYDDNMSKIFFDELNIPSPDYNLGISQSSHGAMTGRMLEKLDELMQQLEPDCVLVYGDTNSTIAGALAASKLHIPVAHVESGLRSFNKKMPEEINRVLTDHCSDFLFAPTDTAVANLVSEGLSESKIFKVGDVMYDASVFFGEKADRESKILDSLVNVSTGGYLLATIHRAENTDDVGRLKNIMKGLALASNELPVVFPVHPRTRAVLEREGLYAQFDANIHYIDPVGYVDMVKLEKEASIIVTDSGGVQKEAYFYRVPCVTLRDETEWTELVDAGWNRLVPPHSDKNIADGINKAVGSRGEDKMLYGNGNAGVEIISRLSNLL